MAAHLHKATRAAWSRRTRALLERRADPDFDLDRDLTPPPVAVAVDLPAGARLADAAVEPAAPALKHEFNSLPPPPVRSRFPLVFAALALVGAVAGGSRLLASTRAVGPRMLASLVSQAHVATLAELGAPEPPSEDPPENVAISPASRADAHVTREGYAHIPGGVLYLPDTFASADGTYDLYLHFHGNVRVVRESAEHAGLNAVVAVVNLGTNSAPYLDGFAVPGRYEELLASIDRAVTARGLEHPHRRRVAIGSWSGGYGAVSRILEHGRGLSSLDAILVLDGIHCGFSEEDPRLLNTRIISPFFDATRRAAEGKILFSITHSEIDPITYAGTYLTAGYLLDLVHGQKAEPKDAAPEHVQLKAAEGAVSKALEKFMEPTYEATVGTFHVRGYRGNTPEHHMAHLLQMSATVMPELVARWRTTP
ncbi:MAG: hypothetical protein ABJE95_23430 [Byssovorax sp.]